jgi:predicted acyl esterase
MFTSTWAYEVAAASKPADTKGVELEWGLKIPLRDGVRLNGIVYKPQAMTEPLPVIFTLTPYIGDSYHERGTYFAKNDYVFVCVDARGRGNSEGQFEPFLNEGRDSHDVVEWLAVQPWCNGKVAKGSRLHLVIRAPNSIYWQKNYNSGGDVSAESAQDARTAHVTLYHDAEHPSHLELPVAQ